MVKLPFQYLNGLAYSGLRDKELFGSFGKAQGNSYMIENLIKLIVDIDVVHAPLHNGACRDVVSCKSPEDLSDYGQPDGGAGLQDQDGGHAHDEIPVPGFVMKEIHSCQGSHRTAQKGSQEQRFLGNPPLAPAGLSLVRAHEGKAEDVHKKQIDQKKIRD